MRTDLLSADELRVESDRFLTELAAAVGAGSADADISGPQWGPVKDLLMDLSRTRATRGFTPTETATFVFSLKQPLFDEARRVAARRHRARRCGSRRRLIDALGLFTTEAYLRSREEIIQRQQEELMELSTPVVKLWQGVVALPLIGTLDSARTQVVMESLLEKIVETDSAIAIIDITGVPTVDTLVAQHLLKTVAAARLMGADCIISGIRPQIAQTIVHLGVDLPGRHHQGEPRRRVRGRARRAPALPDHAASRKRRRSRRRGERIPILKLGHLLLVTIQVDMHDRLAMALQDDLTERIADTGARGRADRHLVARARRLVHRPDAVATSPRCRACSTPRPSSSACGRRSRSRWSSSASPCRACAPR